MLFETSCKSQQNTVLVLNCETRVGSNYSLNYSDSIVELIPASFPNGDEELVLFLEKSAKNYTNSLEKQYNETLYIRFTISEKGIIEDYCILRPIKGCFNCDSIAIDLIKKMPKWIPAYGIYKNGIKKNEKYQKILPIKF